MDILVYTSIYKDTLFTTTLHLESGLICLAPANSLNLTPLLVIPGSLLPFFSRLNWQTTQAWLATPKQPQPLVYLIHIAVTPAMNCCCVDTAHLETRIPVLVVHVRDSRSCVSSQKQLHEGNSTHHVLYWSHVQTLCWGWFVQLDYLWVLHWSLDGQMQLLKGVEEYQTIQVIIWYAYVKNSIYYDVQVYTCIYLAQLCMSRYSSSAFFHF